MSPRSPYAKESDSIMVSLGSSEENPKNRVHREQRPRTPDAALSGLSNLGAEPASPRHAHTHTSRHLPGGSLRANLFRHLYFFPPVLLSLNTPIFQNNQTFLQEFKLPENKQIPGLLPRQFPPAVSPSQATSCPLLGFKSNLAMIT